MWVLIVILAIPVLEIALFVQFGAMIGVWGTLAQVFASAALGIVLMRLEPHRSADQVRAALARDASPASPMAHSALRMIGALLFVLPGFFTDTVGLLLMVPLVRSALLSRMLVHVRTARAPRDDVIEGDYETHCDPPNRPNPQVEDHQKRD